MTEKYSINELTDAIRLEEFLSEKELINKKIKLTKNRININQFDELIKESNEKTYITQMVRLQVVRNDLATLRLNLLKIEKDVEPFFEDDSYIRSKIELIEKQLEEVKGAIISIQRKVTNRYV